MCLLGMDTNANGKKMLGERLKAARDTATLTVAELASRVKIVERDPRTYIYEVESGKANPTLDMLERLYQSCGTSLETVLNGLWKNPRTPAEQGLHDTLDAIQAHIRETANRELNTGLQVL